MESSTLTLNAPDGTSVHIYRWSPPQGRAPKAVVQIAHGLAEHAARYARFAEALTAAGYVVYAEDHRGHGRTAPRSPARGYLADGDGFDVVIEDMHALTMHAQGEHPGLPVFLMGHSMGSFLARGYAAKHGAELAGLILSGTAGDPGVLGLAGGVVAAVQSKVRGRRHPSGLMDMLSFGSYNKGIDSPRTKFDWLSRDPDEVDKYVADEGCGFVASCGLYQDLLRGLASVNSDATVARIPRSLPVHVMSGDRDPVGAYGAGPKAVAEQLRRLGVADVTEQLYPGGRHEMLNETNRDEVEAGLIAWLDAHV